MNEMNQVDNKNTEGVENARELNEKELEQASGGCLMGRRQAVEPAFSVKNLETVETDQAALW